MPLILVVDDRVTNRALLARLAASLAHDAVIRDFSDPLAALEWTASNTPDLVLTDFKMPGLNGQQIYERLRKSHPRLSERLIFITGDVINDKIQNFLRERNKVCLSKPFSIVEFRSAIENH